MKLKRKQLGNLLRTYFPDYRGRNIELIFTTSENPSYRIHSSQLYWSGGSKTEFVVLDTQGRSIDTKATRTSSPLHNNHDMIEIFVKADMMIIELVKMGRSSWMNIYISEHSLFLPRLIQ